MNTRYKNTPEVISAVSGVDRKGKDSSYGDKVLGVQVTNVDRTPLVLLDIRDFKGGSIMIEVELSELMSALTQAMVNSERPAK